jgi:hypothetical protein
MAAPKNRRYLTLRLIVFTAEVLSVPFVTALTWLVRWICQQRVRRVSGGLSLIHNSSGRQPQEIHGSLSMDNRAVLLEMLIHHKAQVRVLQ